MASAAMLISRSFVALVHNRSENGTGRELKQGSFSLSLSLSNRQIITPLELRFSSRIHGRPSPETSNDDALLYQRRAGTVSVLKTLTDGEKKSLVEFLYLVSILAVF